MDDATRVKPSPLRPQITQFSPIVDHRQRETLNDGRAAFDWLLSPAPGLLCLDQLNDNSFAFFVLGR
jgi:hypothetical protein